jgi:hypothetical protein
MNDDVLNHVIKFCKDAEYMCKLGNLMHEGGKESALETYTRIIEMLTDMKDV